MKELEVLKRPISPKEIHWRIQSAKNQKTTVVPYLTSRCVMDRFDEQFGPLGWSNSFEKWGAKGVKCGISVILDTGQIITKYDGADETNIEATKGGFSDSMKRTAVQWGLGRDLYEYPRIQIEGEHKYLSRAHEKGLADLAKRVADGVFTGDYFLLGGNQPEQTPQKETMNATHPNWDKCVKYLRGVGSMGDLEKKYIISDDVKEKLIAQTLG